MSLLAFLPLMLNGQRTQENVVPLKTSRLRCSGNPIRWSAKPLEEPCRSFNFPQIKCQRRSYLRGDHFDAAWWIREAVRLDLTK